MIVEASNEGALKMQFIVIEGLDGSGKTTATELLKARFDAAGLQCLPTFEPTRSPVGEIIHSIVGGAIKNIDSTTMALLFAADRFHHLNSEIVPALKHSHVICDRYYYSSMAYQGFDAASLAQVIAYNQAAMDIRRPDIVFFLDVAPEESIRRIDARGEARSVYEKLPRLKLMQARYKAAMARMGSEDNIVVIDTNINSAEAVVEIMWECIRRRL